MARQAVLNIGLDVEIQYFVLPDNNGNATVNSNCRGIAFENAGTQMAYINGRKFPPASVVSYGGQIGDNITTPFTFTFTGAGTPIINVTKEVYPNINMLPQ